MKMLKITILCALLIAAITSIWVYISATMRKESPYHDTLLVQKVECGSNWQEFDVTNLIKSDRDRSMISVRFTSPFIIDFEGDGGLKTNYGDTLDLLIQLVDSEGLVLEMPHLGARGNYIGTYRTQQAIPVDKPFMKMRLRCGSPIKIEKVYWTTYYLKDLR